VGGETPVRTGQRCEPLADQIWAVPLSAALGVSLGTGRWPVASSPRSRAGDWPTVRGAGRSGIKVVRSSASRLLGAISPGSVWTPVRHTPRLPHGDADSDLRAGRLGRNGSQYSHSVSSVRSCSDLRIGSWPVHCSRTRHGAPSLTNPAQPGDSIQATFMSNLLRNTQVSAWLAGAIQLRTPSRARATGIEPEATAVS